MKSKLFIISIFLALHAYAQEPIVVGKKFSLRSAILNEDYTVLVSLPYNYELNGNIEKYPVIYVLDGDGYLTLVSEATSTLSAKNGNGSRGMPQCIVVGITSNNRDRDMSTPLMTGWSPPQDPRSNVSKPTWGGSDKYLEHIEKEIVPYIESNYRTQPFRVIIGHSLGGLLAYRSMITRPKLFQTYIIGDPAVWWNDGNDLRAVMKYWKDHPDFKASLALFRLAVPREYWFPINQEFFDFMNTSKPPKLSYVYMEFEKETHSTVVFPGVYTALRNTFDDYRYNMHRNASEEDAKKHYDSLSAEFGYKIPVPDDVVRVIGEMKAMQKNRN